MNNIKYYRGIFGLSQEKHASMVGMSRTNLTYIEMGYMNTVSKGVEKIAEILGVSIIKLLGEENMKYIPESVEDIDYMISLLEDMKKKVEVTKWQLVK